MDSITQAVLGASIQGALLGRWQGRRALLYGAMLGTLPDLDVIIDYGDAVADMTYHRGFSHSLFVLSALALALTLAGLDWVTALTGAATAVCNVGPGLGPIIGPVGNFASLPDSAKWLLTIGMLLGRLEILTVLVLLFPAFWRH